MQQGGVVLEGNYGAYFGNQLVGKVQVIRQGLYYRFVCRCKLSGDVVCRLYVRCGEKRENLGVVAPVDSGFGLDTKLPVKRLGEGKPEFQLLPKHEAAAGKFVPICPEEPFAYIARLKDAFLTYKDGQAGIMVKEK